MGRFAILAVALAAATGAVQGGFYEAEEAYERGDYATALLEWRSLAADGDPESQFRVGRMYARGEGERSDVDAVKWYRMAAERGHPSAQNNLALFYESGLGVDLDLVAAARWYRAAADQGLAVAQSNLARFYDEGIGVAEEPERAARWYQRAAGQQHAASQFRLGQMFEEGRGVPADSKKAAKWYRRAAKNGSSEAADALHELELREFSRSTVEWSEKVQEPPPPVETVAAVAAPAPDAPPVVDAAAEPRSPADPRSGAESGDADAQFELGRAYSTGHGVKLDMEEAARWYLAAAEQGHAMAAYSLGFAYWRSRGVDNDLVQAYRWFSVAADQDVGDAADWVRKIEAKLNDSQREAAERFLAEP
jgi:TPR repeat protein